MLIFLDQIASGSKAIEVLTRLNQLGVNEKRIRVITTLSASSGLKNIGEEIKDLTIYCACIDTEVNEKGEMVPGIGNPSERINTIFTPSN